MKTRVKTILTVAGLASALMAGGSALAMQQIDCPAGPHATLCEGTNRADALIDNSARNTIQGHDGADYLFGGFGADYLSGGKGNDSIAAGENQPLHWVDPWRPARGEPGIDRVEGGGGNDTILAADGIKDQIDCGAGTDSVTYDRNLDIVQNCENLSPVG